MGLSAILLVIVLVAFDRATKYAAELYLRPIVTIPVIDGVFSLTYVENEGAAFGMLQGARWFFVVLTIVVLCFMLYYYRRLPNDKPNLYVKLCILFVAAGAIGNFIDRVWRGYVVDFLHFTLIDFPVFNAADCFVSCGAFAMAFLLVFVVKD